MKYFLDSAKIEEIKYALENWKIEGVTSNPRHIKTAGKPFYTIVKELAKEFEKIDFPISIEINPHIDKANDIIQAAKKIASLSKNFVIKIPCTEQGLAATTNLIKDGIKVNVTLVFTASQALQAGRIGAKYVSPFIGWQEASGIDCTNLITDMVIINENYGFETEIIVAAVRSGKQIVEAAVLGADIVTASFEVYKDSFYHPYTDRGLKIFQDAWDNTEIGFL